MLMDRAVSRQQPVSALVFWPMLNCSQCGSLPRLSGGSRPLPGQADSDNSEDAF